MSDVTIMVNRKPYRLACEDGQEDHLHILAARIDERVVDLVDKFGQIGEQQLLLMVGLLLADESEELRRRLATQELVAQDEAQAAQAAGEAAADLLEQASHRIEALAGTVESLAAELNQ